MTVYDKLSRRPQAFRSLTGSRLEAFARLHKAEVDKIDRSDESRLKQRPRERAIGAGGQYSQDARNRLLMAMIWLRTYPTYEVLGFLFDLHKSNIGRNLERVLAVLREALGEQIQWLDQTQRKRKMDDFLRDFPDVVGIVGATEQPIRHPQDPEAQKAH